MTATNSKSTMNKNSAGGNNTSGGRVSLNREVLMNLRKTKGLSQELLALMCAEQRLCVSIASIKRAEMGNNILFRTARDIAKFFDVDLVEIISTSNNEQKEAQTKLTSSTNNDTLKNSELQVYIDSKRQIVVLISEPNIFNTLTRSSIVKYWKSVSELTARQFDAELVYINETRLAFLFGNQTMMGYEHLQAIHCAKSLEIQMRMMLNNNGVMFSQISYYELLPLDNKPQSVKKISQVLCDSLGKEFVLSTEMAKDQILVSESIKQSLGSQFSFTSNFNTECNNSPINNSCWLLNNESLPITEVNNFIGRDLQQQQFRAAVESVFAYNELQVIYIRGMAGIGKTRLLEKFSEYAKSLGFECHKAHVLDFGTDNNQMAIPKLIRSLLHLSTDDFNLDYIELNARFGSTVCEEHELLFLYSWLNWTLTGKDLLVFNAMSHEARSIGLQRVVKELIRNSTKKSPLLFCIEDMHWANDDLLDSIQHFVDVLKDTQVILLLTSRIENDPLKKKWRSAWLDVSMLAMNLSPLRDSEALKFVDYFTNVSTEYKQQCIQRAEGNPLFLEQLLLDDQPSLGNLPNSVQTLVLSKLDRLSSQCRTAARAAAVLGQWFTADALNFILQTDNFNIDPLIDHYLVKRVADRYQFIHALVHQGVYETITEQSLIKLHLRCAQWFESTDIALQAQHLSRAKNKNATNVYLQAIKIKIDEFSFVKANILVDEALAIDFTSIYRAPFWLLKGDIMIAKGNTELAIECYQNTLDQANTENEKFIPLIGLAIGLDTLEKYDDALLALTQAETCISTDNIYRDLSQIHYLRGNFYFPRGQVDDCRQQHNKALNFARLAKDAHAEAKALGGLGDAAYAQGKMVTACQFFKQCLELCFIHELTKVESANRFMLGTTRIYLNETMEALQDALESANLAKAVGHKRAEIVSRLTAGWILLDTQELDQAKEQIESGLALAHEIGAHRFKPFLSESLARYHFYKGDKKTAKKIIVESCNDIQKQQIEKFIGPWIISTYALILNTNKEATTLLIKGSDLLQQNCVGHNYYRFYVNAMESCLVRKDWASLNKYRNEFETYTHEEPSPWSNYYIARSKLIEQAWCNDATPDLLNQLEEIIELGTQSGLKHSLEMIIKTIVHVQQRLQMDPGQNPSSNTEAIPRSGY